MHFVEFVRCLMWNFTSILENSSKLVRETESQFLHFYQLVPLTEDVFLLSLTLCLSRRKGFEHLLHPPLLVQSLLPHLCAPREGIAGSHITDTMGYKAERGGGSVCVCKGTHM